MAPKSGSNGNQSSADSQRKSKPSGERTDGRDAASGGESSAEEDPPSDGGSRPPRDKRRGADRTSRATSETPGASGAASPVAGSTPGSGRKRSHWRVVRCVDVPDKKQRRDRSPSLAYRSNDDDSSSEEEEEAPHTDGVRCRARAPDAFMDILAAQLGGRAPSSAGAPGGDGETEEDSDDGSDDGVDDGSDDGADDGSDDESDDGSGDEAVVQRAVCDIEVRTLLRTAPLRAAARALEIAMDQEGLDPGDGPLWARARRVLMVGLLKHAD